jgi:hypothetical protein
MENESVNYHESLIQKLGRPYITECPDHYLPSAQLLEQAQRGEVVSQEMAFCTYFKQMKDKDPNYYDQILKMVDQRSKNFIESQRVINGRKLQIVIPAYREGENMDNILTRLSEQMLFGEDNWGVTIVIDHAIPYRNRYETSAKNEMIDKITLFLKENPQYKNRLDYIFYTRRKDSAKQALPVGLARKVGEDVLMREWLNGQLGKTGEAQPFYLGLMDMDTAKLSPGLLSEMANAVPNREDENARVIRVKGSFDKIDIQHNLDIHPLQMMWEGTTSEVGRNSKHNPFNIGRLSAVPARELAMTGGGFAKRLQFPDEDIRHGIQIKWNLPHVYTLELSGRYSTSARREVNTVEGVRRRIEENGGEFDLATMEIGALIRMYGDWSNNTYRRDLGNITGSINEEEDNPLQHVGIFEKHIPTQLIQTMANAFYRFTAFSMYAVDALGDHIDASEIQNLKSQFLQGEIPYFQVQLKTLDMLRKIAIEEPDRFHRLKSVLAQVDTKARQSVAKVLQDHGISFDLQEGTIFGLLEELNYGSLFSGHEPKNGRDNIKLSAPFKIIAGQKGYMNNVRSELMIL